MSNLVDLSVTVLILACCITKLKVFIRKARFSERKYANYKPYRHKNLGTSSWTRPWRNLQYSNNNIYSHKYVVYLSICSSAAAISLSRSLILFDQPSFQPFWQNCRMFPFFSWFPLQMNISSSFLPAKLQARFFGSHKPSRRRCLQTRCTKQVRPAFLFDMAKNCDTF